MADACLDCRRGITEAVAPKMAGTGMMELYASLGQLVMLSAFAAYRLRPRSAVH